MTRIDEREHINTTSGIVERSTAIATWTSTINQGINQISRTPSEFTHSAMSPRVWRCANVLSDSEKRNYHPPVQSPRQQISSCYHPRSHPNVIKSGMPTGLSTLQWLTVNSHSQSLDTCMKMKKYSTKLTIFGAVYQLGLLKSSLYEVWGLH
jgi:hypothetical protein